MSSLFFISYLILVLAWPLSGPITAAVLSILASIVAFYLILGSKEPAIFLQIFIYGGLFIFMVSYLHGIQNKNNDQTIAKEKITEEIHLIREELHKKELLKIALEEKIKRFLDLHRFSGELKDGADLQDVAKKIVREAYSVLGKADECVLYLVNESKQELSLVGSMSASGESVKEKEGTSYERWVMKKSQAVLIEDTRNDFRFPKELAVEFKRLRSLCVSPLVTENKVLGVVRVSSEKPLVFTSDDLRLLDIFSALGAVTLKNILLYEKMEELAARDSLTNLYLYRYFQERLLEEISRANFNKLTFSIILLDIDHFKHYNDDYGHAAGDIVLKNIAAIILKCTEPVDLVARYGGEEFAILLPNKGRKEALQLAEKIRTEIERSKFRVRRIEGRVTASLGVAVFPEGGRTREELIWTADRYLYQAKESGRNRVCGNI